jgi:hypothetical protein
LQLHPHFRRSSFKFRIDVDLKLGKKGAFKAFYMIAVAFTF